MPYTLKPQSSLKTTFTHFRTYIKLINMYTPSYICILVFKKKKKRVCSFTDGDVATPLTSRLSLAFVGLSELLVQSKSHLSFACSMTEKKQKNRVHSSRTKVI